MVNDHGRGRAVIATAYVLPQQSENDDYGRVSSSTMLAFACAMRRNQATGRPTIIVTMHIIVIRMRQNRKAKSLKYRYAARSTTSDSQNPMMNLIASQAFLTVER